MKSRTGKMQIGTEIRKNEKSEAEKWGGKHLLHHNARTAATTRIAPALPRRASSCVDRLSFFFNGGSTSRLQCAESVAPTQIDENEHDGPHVSSESQVVITTDTCPIDSRTLGVGWVALFGFACYGPAL